MIINKRNIWVSGNLLYNLKKNNYKLWPTENKHKIWVGIIYSQLIEINGFL